MRVADAAQADHGFRPLPRPVRFLAGREGPGGPLAALQIMVMSYITESAATPLPYPREARMTLRINVACH